MRCLLKTYLDFVVLVVSVVTGSEMIKLHFVMHIVIPHTKLLSVTEIIQSRYYSYQLTILKTLFTKIQVRGK